MVLLVRFKNKKIIKLKSNRHHKSIGNCSRHIEFHISNKKILFQGKKCSQNLSKLESIQFYMITQIIKIQKHLSQQRKNNSKYYLNYEN